MSLHIKEMKETVFIRENSRAYEILMKRAPFGRNKERF